jgi:hypothetical protein
MHIGWTYSENRDSEQRIGGEDAEVENCPTRIATEVVVLCA